MLARRIKTTALALAIALTASAAPAADVVDRIGVPGPLKVDGRDYVLVASTQPMPNSIRQDYIPAWQSLKSWRDMVTVEVTSGTTVPAALAAHEEALTQKRAKGTPVHMRTWHNKGESLIEFRVDGRNLFGFGTAEWSATRYAPSGDGVMRFAVTRRATEDVKAFLADLGHTTSHVTDAVANYVLPVARPKAGS